jgi:hypothetical protein
VQVIESAQINDKVLGHTHLFYVYLRRLYCDSAERFTPGAFVDGDLGGMTRDELVFTENETNSNRVFGFKDGNRCVKNAFQNLVIRDEVVAVNPHQIDTKALVIYKLTVPAGSHRAPILRETRALHETLHESAISP